jgi:hypothetical protein
MFNRKVAEIYAKFTKLDLCEKRKRILKLINWKTQSCKDLLKRKENLLVLDIVISFISYKLLAILRIPCLRSTTLKLINNPSLNPPNFK